MIKIFKLNYFIVLFLIYLASILLRSQYLNRPPIDAHPMRQTDTACVIYHYAQRQASFLEPRTCLIRPSTNLEGYFFFEFPLYTWLSAQSQIIFNSFEFWPIRIVNLLLFSISFWVLFIAIKRFFNKDVAFWSVFLFSFVPSSIFFFGQAIHPDIMMITSLILAFNFLTLFLKNKKEVSFFLMLLFLNITLATRPFTALTLVPFSYILFAKKQKLKAIMTLIFSGLLLGAWKLWQEQFPDADHTWQQWIFSGREQLKNLEFVKRLVLTNLVGEVIGKFTSLLALAGVVVSLRTIFKGKFKEFLRNHKIIFLLLWLLMIPVFWIIVPAGNWAHQYYAHVIMLPIIMLAAYFIVEASQLIKSRLLKATFLIIIAFLVILNGIRTSRYFYMERISQPEQQLATEISNHTTQGSKVIYLGIDSLAFSLANRQGWTIVHSYSDLKRTAQSVASMFNEADFVIKPDYDGTFPQEELDKILPDLELIFESDAGRIYTIKN